MPTTQRAVTARYKTNEQLREMRERLAAQRAEIRAHYFAQRRRYLRMAVLFAAVHDHYQQLTGQEADEAVTKSGR